MRRLPAFVFTAATLIATSVFADDLREQQLLQDVRDLQRVVQQQGQKIDNLERALSQLRPVGSAGGPAGSRSMQRPQVPELSPAWLTIANWDRIHSGSNELEVIAALGPPTAIRKSDDGVRQTLLYSLEIAAGGFLSGQVLMSDHRVQEIQKPALK